MAARKWLVRGLIPVLVGLVVGAGFYASALLKPSYIREQLIAHLHEKFSDVDVEVGGARLRFFGGISVSDLKIIRKDDPARVPILEIPAAVLQHDRERLSQGRIVIRKIDMVRPVVRVVRKVDGTWNWTGVLGGAPGDGDPAPVFALRDARMEIRDELAGRSLTFDAPKIVLLNDPKTVFKLEAAGRTDRFGPVTATARYDQSDGTFRLDAAFDDLRVTEANIDWLAAYAPDAKEEAGLLRGRASLQIALTGKVRPEMEIHPFVQFRLSEGKFAHASLPLPFDAIETSGELKDNVVTVAPSTARSGGSEVAFDGVFALPDRGEKVPVRLAARSAPAPVGAIRSLNLSLKQVKLSEEFFRKLPHRVQVLHRMFQPVGPTDIGYCVAIEDGALVKRCRVTPRGVAGRYEGFPYPLTNLAGSVEQVMVPGRPDVLYIDLTAEAKGRPVSLTGTISGDTPEEKDVKLVIKGRGIEVDEDLIAALPEHYPNLVRRLRPDARGNFTATIRHDAAIRRDHGPAVFDNLFDIDLYNTSLSYLDFPYPLRKVAGKLLIRTVPDSPSRLPETGGSPSPRPAESTDDDRGSFKFQGFTAEHAGATLRIDGSRAPSTGGNKLSFKIEGTGVPFDLELREALARLQLDHVWQTFDLQGKMNCVIEANVYERSRTPQDPEPRFKPAEDLALGISFAGPAVRPGFLPYLLQGLKGQLSYYRGTVKLTNFEGWHRGSHVRLPSTDVVMRPTGGYRAEILDLSIDPIRFDAEMLAALPKGLRDGCLSLRLDGPMSLYARKVVVDEKAGMNLPEFLPVKAVMDGEQTPHRTDASKPAVPLIEWDGRLLLNGSSFDTGVAWRNAKGEFACVGRYEGDRLAETRGNLYLESATLLNQQADRVFLRVEVDKDRPNVLLIPSVQAKMYGGDITGEARVLVDDPVRFDLNLNASRMKLSEFAKKQKLGADTRLEGLASGRLRLWNHQRGENGKPLLEGGRGENGKPLLEGYGGLDIPDGSKILNVPKLVNVLKAMKLRVPDETFFEEAHAAFRVRGDKVYFGQIDLLGDAVSLGGSGGMNLDGTGVNLEFYTMSRFHDMLRAPLSGLSAAVSRNILRINVHGDFDGKLEYKSQAVPLITGPVRRILDIDK